MEVKNAQPISTLENLLRMYVCLNDKIIQYLGNVFGMFEWNVLRMCIKILYQCTCKSCGYHIVL